jgi:thiol-disulfide isomerase/thioredoxin
MKKLTLILIFILIINIPESFSQNRKITFIEKPWSEILALAKKENKLIFMDAFASWCGPCKWVAANIFTNDTIADYYNNTFICVSIDMEKGEGVQIRNTYGVQYYPSFLFINSNGEIVHENVGAARKIQDYIRMAKTALNPEENLAGYKKKFNAGNTSDTFIAAYLSMLSDAYLPTRPVLEQYFSTKSEEEMLSRPIGSIILRYVNEMDMPQFDFLVKHQQEYARIFTRDSVDSKISGIFMTALMKQTRTASMTDTMYNMMKRKILQSGFDGAAKVVFTSDLNLFQTRKENQKFLDLVYMDLEKYYPEDHNMLNNVSWQVGQICLKMPAQDALKYLNKALLWSKRSISIKSEPDNNDTYAYLLFKTGNTKKAIKYEKIAISLAKQLSQPSTEFEKFLKKMEDSQEKTKP